VRLRCGGERLLEGRLTLPVRSMYGGSQQKSFPPAYLGIADMRAYAMCMHDMQFAIFHI